MLVHHHVEGVGLEHERQVVQLHDPDPVVGQGVGHVLDEGRGVLQVVEHGDARDDLRAPVGLTLVQEARAEEVTHDVVPLGDGMARHVGGVEA